MNNFSSNLIVCPENLAGINGTDVNLAVSVVSVETVNITNLMKDTEIGRCIAKGLNNLSSHYPDLYFHSFEKEITDPASNFVSIMLSFA